MIYLTILALLLLAAISYLTGGRKLLYPPVCFSVIWAANLILIRLMGDFFYPLSGETLAIIFWGAFAFTIGCFLGLLWPQSRPRTQPSLSLSSNRLINLLLCTVALGFPFYIRWIIKMAGDDAVGTFLGAVRRATLEEGHTLVETLFLNLTTLSSIVAVLAFRERKGHRTRAIIAFVLALAMNVLLGAKAGGTVLLLALASLSWLQSRRIPWKFVAVMGLLVIAMFGFLQFSVQMGGSFLDNISPVAQAMALYVGGPTIALDRVVREPAIVPHTFPIYTPFLYFFRNLGFGVDVPDRTQYVAVGPGAATQNAYTMFWSYLDFGHFGMMVPLLFIGFIVTVIYQRALQEHRIAQLLYSFLAAGLMLSPFAEYLFLNLNFLSKLCVLTWLVYFSPAAWDKFRQLMGRGVRAQLATYGDASR